MNRGYTAISISQPGFRSKILFFKLVLFVLLSYSYVRTICEKLLLDKQVYILTYTYFFFSPLHGFFYRLSPVLNGRLCKFYITPEVKDYCHLHNLEVTQFMWYYNIFIET